MSHSATLTADRRERTTWLILIAISLCHMLNDVMQSLLAAIYPLLKTEFSLQFWQIGFLTLAFQGTASLLQPAVGAITDRKPMPMSRPARPWARSCCCPDRIPNHCGAGPTIRPADASPGRS